MLNELKKDKLFHQFGTSEYFTDFDFTFSKKIGWENRKISQYFSTKNLTIQRKPNTQKKIQLIVSTNYLEVKFDATYKINGKYEVKERDGKFHYKYVSKVEVHVYEDCPERDCDLGKTLIPIYEYNPTEFDLAISNKMKKRKSVNSVTKNVLSNYYFKDNGIDMMKNKEANKKSSEFHVTPLFPCLIGKEKVDYFQVSAPPFPQKFGKKLWLY